MCVRTNGWLSIYSLPSLMSGVGVAVVGSGGATAAAVFVDVVIGGGMGPQRRSRITQQNNIADAHAHPPPTHTRCAETRQIDRQTGLHPHPIPTDHKLFTAKPVVHLHCWVPPPRPYARVHTCNAVVNREVIGVGGGKLCVQNSRGMTTSVYWSPSRRAQWGGKSRKMAENSGKLREIAVPYPNLPKPQRATLLHRGHTGHQQGHEVDKQKSNCGTLRENCEIAESCEKLRKIAGLHFQNLPPPLLSLYTHAGCRLWIHQCAAGMLH